MKRKSAPALLRAGMIAALSAALLAGCATFRPAEPDAVVEVPLEWSRVSVDEALWPEADWWRGFGSGELDALIERARESSPDLAAAWERILQAEARARIAGASLLPELDFAADAGRSGAIGGGAGSIFGLSLGAAYEVDLWGRNSADRAAARALVAASVHDQETVALTLSAGVADVYLQILSLRERIAVARLNLEVAEGVLRLVEVRERFGSASPLDLAQQRAAVAQQRAGIPALEQQEREARAALALLLGETPQGFDVAAPGLTGMAVPEVAPGLPAELLQRRPDIRRAEMELIAAEADIAIARSALYPSLRLTGSLGLRSDELSTLFDGDPLWSVASALAMPIFNSGRLAANRDLAESRHRELLHGYRAAILAAFADVDTVLADLEALQEQARWQTEARREAETALSLAETRYRAGAADLLAVLDAQRTLYQARDSEVQLRAERLRAQVALFRALGGGWGGGRGSM
ncbi:MAG: efflux transporter outer membrane subunit [Gammaproteobacteria bacterium]|jgi:NodT family efflux transporter outer membrane factor (OMF) lipoprotein|nr:efflux transporter outer membrane subunit [Gammaproteobacteria bacterium]